MKNILPGGKASKMKPADFDPKELELGIKTEMEHTNNKDLAKEIAMDHLAEFPNYYTELLKMEKKLESKAAMENPIRQNYDYGGNFLDKVKEFTKRKNRKNNRKTRLKKISQYI